MGGDHMATGVILEIYANDVLFKTLSGEIGGCDILQLQQGRPRKRNKSGVQRAHDGQNQSRYGREHERLEILLFYEDRPHLRRIPPTRHLPGVGFRPGHR